MELSVSLLLTILLASIIWVLKDLVQSFVIGLVFLLHPSLRVGDRIRIDDKEGKIIVIGIKWTQLLDSENQIWFIRNEELWSKNFKKLIA